MRIAFLSAAIQSAIIAGRFWKEEAPLENSRKCFTSVPQKDPVATTTQLVFHPLVPAGKIYIMLLPINLYFLYWNWRAKKRHMGLCSLSPFAQSIYILV